MGGCHDNHTVYTALHKFQVWVFYYYGCKGTQPNSFDILFQSLFYSTQENHFLTTLHL